ncbi:MAG: MBL fold metallo-hydrolase [Desulfobacterales bacterium]|nr:MBL fold metallo-hydrolase [Desulfobacterales bacterium]
MLKITIIYDNTAWLKSLPADWGFACLVEAQGKKILFDTGAKGSLLLSNMQALQIDPLEVDAVFISHNHWDHTGGLIDFLKVNPVSVYLPDSCPHNDTPAESVRVGAPLEIYPGIYSTGELQQIEQSLVIRAGSGIVVVAGCAHPGVEAILTAAAPFGRVRALVGGLHGFDDFRLIKSLETVCPTHCTRHIPKIKARFPDAFISGGTGRVISID